jgi:molecular chaperone GrpE
MRDERPDPSDEAGEDRLRRVSAEQAAAADARVPAGETGAGGGGASGPGESVATDERLEVEELKRALGDQRDKYLRLLAEQENFKKRSIRERQEAGSRAQGEMIRGLIDGLDDLTRFAHVDPAAVDAATLVKGIEMVERKLMKSLGGHGLEVVDPVDQPFDPALHEAVGTEPALSREDDHLIGRVYQRGYVLNGQLLRPARVVVKQWAGDSRVS